jgi:hypothetical protein
MINEIPQNAAKFSRELVKISALVNGDYSRVVKKSALDLFSRIASRTPVESGRARGNWNISFEDGTIVEEITGGKSVADSKIAKKAKEFSFSIVNDRIVIYNNVEYIQALEDGWSSFAPQGMVSTSLQDFYLHLKTEIGKISYMEPT